MRSIFGAIIFLRLGWAVGQAGIWATLSIFAVAGLTVTLTALSISAISTNGTMKGGGAYFMISRSLGPEFGGSVGLIFFLANAVAATFHLAAFAENFCESFECTPNGIMGNVRRERGFAAWVCLCHLSLRPASCCRCDCCCCALQVVVASIALFILLLACLPGAAVFSKLNAYIYIVMVFAIVSMALSLSVRGNEHEVGPRRAKLAHAPRTSCQFRSVARDVDGHTGLDSSTFSDNMGESYTGKYSFWKVFAVVFPSCTGIMAGANLSGDLKDPGAYAGQQLVAACLVALCFLFCE